MDILWKWEMAKERHMDLFKNCYRLMLTSGAETWAHTKAHVTIPTAARDGTGKKYRKKTTKKRERE
jgi:hypothetical protein